MRGLLASPLGFLIGVSLGALGGGGSILAVPALVYVAGQSAQEATATSLLVVGLVSLGGLVPHWRAGRVRAGAGLVFGLAGVAGSLLGSALNESADPDALLLAFSGLMLVAAAAMVRRTRRSAPARAGGPAGGQDAVQTALRVDAATVLKVLLAGSVVGLLTGFFGVGGGFVIVPALVLALGFSMPEAVGTSLLVIAINSAVALAARLDAGTLDWGVALPFTAAGLLGVTFGSHLAGRIDAAVLVRWFAALLVAVACYTGLRSALALW
ncbi:MAG: sulfite exporter TauE/SafE family protein [Acidimicrobiia bacterium]|nr:sulfite exporter TauE/SafE family protein [Acidimicrobiia bacterium]